MKVNKEYNVIAVFDSTKQHILMCKRRKNPYKGLYNLVGGKIEKGEDGLSAAYRELQEETGISRDHIILTHLMDFTYYLPGIKLEVYCGNLHEDIPVFGDENNLKWMDINQNFFDITKFAGEGNIGHIMEHVKLEGFVNKIRYADINDAKILGEIHSKSWKVAYKGIVPDEILNNITSEKRQKYFQKALTEGWEEDALIFKGNDAAGLMCIGKCRDKDKDSTYGEIWGIYLLPEYWNM